MSAIAVTLKPGADLDGFRSAARSLIAKKISPDAINWQQQDAPSLFSDPAPQAAPPLSLPRKAADLARLVVCHRDPERYALLYQLLWRLTQGERQLLEIHSDPLVFRLARLAKTIRRDLHKMHAFVRFRRIETEGDERFVAWFEPDHFILEATADFFVDRFRSLHWSILTPIGSLIWDRQSLAIGSPATRADAPDHDAFEAGWQSYYASTFNPARVNVAQMQKEMPKKYWHNMPETKLIPDLLRNAPSRVDIIMSKAPTASRKREPEKALAAMRDTDPQTLAELNAIIAASEPFVTGGQHAVLGEGPMRPKLAFVGEQPGDQEDLQRRPFVGPAGQLLNRALEEAGIDRTACYITNAVKHFKYEQRGKRRLHQKPTTGEVRHYRWWLNKELDLVQPTIVVALGATALLALTDKVLPITKVRGPLSLADHDGYVTVHPSYLLRLPDPSAQEAAYDAFVADLAAARRLADSHRRAA